MSRNIFVSPFLKQFNVRKKWSQPLFLFFVIFVGLATCVVGQNSQQHDWENEQVIGINKEPAHVSSISFPYVETALNSESKDSPYYKSLNGRWKFKWTAKLDDRNKNFYYPTYTVSCYD